VQVGTFIWVDLAAAIVLSVWVTIRHPAFGPRSLFAAAVAFLLGQLVAAVAARVVVPIVQLRHGVQLAVIVVVLPALFGMVLSSLWLMRAAVGTIGGPRAYRTPSDSARGR
jgi:hypothetical protein